MSTPVLTRKQQRKSLSAKKNRKKGHKNILAAPDIFNIRKPFLTDTNIPTLTETLELLLPHARLLRGEYLGKSRTTSLEKSDKTPKEDMLKRNQLFLGINSVSRAVSNGSAACILFGDVKPKLLISHIIVLCSLKKIPYLYVENLTDLTKRTLGFSCVALGFKKDSTFFLPVITTIIGTESQNYKSIMQTSHSNVENNHVIKDADNNSKLFEKSGNTFTYLHRNSISKRAFVPDANDWDLEQNNRKDFISFEAKDEVNGSFSKPFIKKITEGKTYKFKGDVTTQSQMINRKTSKEKCYFPVGYSSTQIIKLGANPNREEKKFVKLKQKKLAARVKINM